MLFFHLQVMAAASSSAESESEEVSERAEEKKVTKKESPPKESRERRRRRRHHRSRESRDRGRSARKDSDRRRRRQESVPEPANPPKAKKEDEAMDDTKGSGKKPRERTWTCMDCGQKTAPYRAAMDQHRYLNENCLACQVWNRLTRDEQNEPSAWHRCKQEARGKKWGRRSELVDRDGFEEIPEEEYRGWSVHSVPAPPPAPSRTSWQRDRSEMPPRMPVELKENSPARESSMKKVKKIKKDDRDSSPEKYKKGKKKDRESTSSHDKDRTAGKRRPKQVVININ